MFINNNMATDSPIRSQNATQLIFVYKSDVIGVEVFVHVCSMKNSGCHGNQSKKPMKISSSQTTNWILLYSTNKVWGYTKVTVSVHLSVGPSVCPSVHHEILLGHNFKSIKASNFQLHTQVSHIVEKCIVKEP